MKNFLIATLAFLILQGIGLTNVHGQTLNGGSMYPSPVSPYININRAGAPAGVNYYNIVQPQIQFQSQINRLQNQITQMPSSPPGEDTTGAFTTGHLAAFGNTSHYFGGGGGGGRMGGGMGGMGGMGMGGMGMGGMAGGGLGQGAGGGMMSLGYGMRMRMMQTNPTMYLGSQPRQFTPAGGIR